MFAKVQANILGKAMLQKTEISVRIPGPLALAFGFFVLAIVVFYLAVMHLLAI